MFQVIASPTWTAQLEEEVPGVGPTLGGHCCDGYHCNRMNVQIVHVQIVHAQIVHVHVPS